MQASADCLALQSFRLTRLDNWCLQGVKNVLSQAYADATQVTDELVDCILQPGLQVNLALEHSAVSLLLSEVSRCSLHHLPCVVRLFFHLAAPLFSVLIELMRHARLMYADCCC